jgi:clan AA aspartic protease (TIGR02281 family)
MGLAEYVNAERTADDLVASNPAAPDAFGWRAEAREKNGNFAGAYADMRKALLLFPDPSRVAAQVYYDTGRLAVESGYPCEAVATLRDFVAYDVRERKTQQLATLMKDWQSRGACPDPFGVGRAILRYNTSSPAIIVPVEANGLLARMILDTGATMTLITRKFAIRAGIEPSVQSGAVVVTANGTTWEAGGRADTIAVGGASLKNVAVLIHSADKDSFADGIDGLLGLSFLGNFQVR